MTITPSHIWGRLYLPMFLFRVGLLTLMYMDSLIVLTKPFFSLHTMLKLSIVVWWPVVVWYLCIGKGAFRCCFYLSPSVLADSVMYSSLQSTLSHLYQYTVPLLHCMGSLSFGDTSMFLIFPLLLEYALMTYLLHFPSMLLQRPCTYVKTMYPLYVMLLQLLLLFLLLFLVL